MLEWNVYFHDFNKKEIIKFNVFQHTSFHNKIKELIEVTFILDKNEFSERARNIAQCYFWSKCEYEVVVTSWPPRITRKEYDRIKDEAMECYKLNINPEVGVKIDIYDQLMINWDRFIDYLWNKKELKI